ncbi:hypothetical protein M422DRAFT_271938 [Sphaerobolus stellatus SS14]|uniref:Uncharacterized protein n=1 Tax=Sphaerobolus stellatus (strain SS14) TaxID=990650 RepID=A0A0C9UN79_SPHS4|nr:hypothetical protein M422DRAFT_271938 [Sphaerobolus stellatus SS14]
MDFLTLATKMNVMDVDKPAAKEKPKMNAMMDVDKHTAEKSPSFLSFGRGGQLNATTGLIEKALPQRRSRPSPSPLVQVQEQIPKMEWLSPQSFFSHEISTPVFYGRKPQARGTRKVAPLPRRKPLGGPLPLHSAEPRYPSDSSESALSIASSRNSSWSSMDSLGA